VDGNKRVAFAVVDVFLRINGYSITADSKAIYEFMMTLFEARTFDMEHLVPWFQKIVRPLAPRTSTS
jgi:death on curing protein